MVVYTISTIIFYILGATILHRADLHPQGMEMIRTLAAMYEPVFGQWAVGLFLVGSVLVLYSTFFVANASKGRVFADAMIVFRWRKSNPRTNRLWVKWLCFAFPIIGLFLLLALPKTQGTGPPVRRHSVLHVAHVGICRHLLSLQIRPIDHASNPPLGCLSLDFRSGPFHRGSMAGLVYCCPPPRLTTLRKGRSRMRYSDLDRKRPLAKSAKKKMLRQRR